jgi:hypothetical protein
MKNETKALSCAATEYQVPMGSFDSDNPTSSCGVGQIQAKRLSGWLEVFPGAKSEYILPKIRKVEAEIACIERDASTVLSQSRKIEDGWFIWEVFKADDVRRLMDLKRELYRLKRYLPQPKSVGRVDQERIDRAKEYPILQVAELGIKKIKKCGGTYRCLCPYHEERTPSFFLYPQANTFYCFGCQVHGDAISLTEKLQNLSFIEAVKYLSPVYGS